MAAEGSIDRISGRLIGWLENVIAALLATTWIIVGTLVALRYIFNSSIPGANEVVVMLFVYTTALGAAIGVGHWDHIGILVFVERLPAKAFWILDLLRTFLVGLINGVIVFYSLGWIHTTGQFVMPSTGLPRFVVQVSIPLGCGLALLFCGLRLRRLIQKGSDDRAGVGEQGRGLGDDA